MVVVAMQFRVYHRRPVCTPASTQMGAALAKREMEQVYRLEVPLLVDVGIGDNWRDAK
jgi:DNA polymerase I-like protein with 3'-5' exonuclease and polymerase domains